MRRDYFTLDALHVDWVEEGGEPQLPTVRVDFQGPETDLRSGFTKPDGSLLESAETDVSFRLQGDPDDPDTEGVVAVTNRVTGDFIFELNVDASDVFSFLNAARRYAEETEDTTSRYRVELYLDGDAFVTYEKDTFLVYTRDGDLLRSQSLIPGGVEL